jgi:hypothetical protein
MHSIHDTIEDAALQDEKNLLAYLEETIIPCAACGEEIEVDDAHRWINRLVCSGCLAEYEGLSSDDEQNYDSVCEEQTDD